MAVNARDVSLTTTPVLVARGKGGSDRENSYLLKASADTLIGGGTADAAGDCLYPIGTADVPVEEIDLRAGEYLWAKAASGTATLHVLETGY